MITMNNRSLTALSEMGGQPSESILIRKIGEIVRTLN